MGQVIQSFKMVVNHAPTSRAAGASITHRILRGVDSISAGQSGPTDADIPTGSVVKFIELQYSAVNLVTVAMFMHTTVQLKRSGNATISPLLVGGNPLRNTIINQSMRNIGKDQNANWVLRLKIPSIYQRIRDGDDWNLVSNASQVYTDAAQFIYKFFR